MDANELVNYMNDRMYKKASDVRFYWSATQSCDFADPKGYFLLWGCRKSEFTYSNPDPIKGVFLYKGMASMIDYKADDIADDFEKYTLKSLPVKRRLFKNFTQRR